MTRLCERFHLSTMITANASSRLSCVVFKVFLFFERSCWKGLEMPIASSWVILKLVLPSLAVNGTSVGKLVGFFKCAKPIYFQAHCCKLQPVTAWIAEESPFPPYLWNTIAKTTWNSVSYSRDSCCSRPEHQTANFRFLWYVIIIIIITNILTGWLVQT